MKPVLFLSLLVLLVSACAPQPETEKLLATPLPQVENPSDAPPPTLDFAAYPTATLAPVPSQGEIVSTGFNIRGWT